MLFAALCAGQTVSSPIVIAQGSGDPETDAGAVGNFEPAIVSSPLKDTEVLVVWRNVVNVFGQQVIYAQYSVSNDGNSFSAGLQIPLPTLACTNQFTGSTDPCVAASAATGDLYCGALTKPDGYFLVARKPLLPAGTLTLISPSAQAGPCDEAGDKDFMAIGPWPAGVSHTNPETAYLAYHTDNGRRIRATDSLPVATVWPTLSSQPGAADDITALTQYAAGNGHCPVVLQSGTNVGRVLVGWARTHTTQPGGWTDPPFWTYSDDAGQTWPTGEHQITQFGTGTPATIYGVLHPGSPAYIPIPGGVPVYTWPYLCTDPTNSNRVWAIFPGRDDDNSSNINLFIAYSDDRGASFPPAQVYEISDAQVRLANELDYASDEWMPSIAVDICGGINIAFLRTVSADSSPISSTYATVRYARWSGQASLASGAIPFRQDLSSTVFHPFTGGAGNEYLMITTSGHKAYAAYAANIGAVGWTVYVNRIDLPCPIADVNADLLVDSNDVLAFGAAFPAGLPPADVNRDGVVNTQDAIDFITDYTCGGCPH